MLKSKFKVSLIIIYRKCANYFSLFSDISRDAGISSLITLTSSVVTEYKSCDNYMTGEKFTTLHCPLVWFDIIPDPHKCTFTEFAEVPLGSAVALFLDLSAFVIELSLVLLVDDFVVFYSFLLLFFCLVVWLPLCFEDCLIWSRSLHIYKSRCI